jgi:hypothetical protein
VKAVKKKGGRRRAASRSLERGDVDRGMEARDFRGAQNPQQINDEIEWLNSN